MTNEQEVKELEEVIASQSKELYQIVIKKLSEISDEVDDIITELGNVA